MPEQKLKTTLKELLAQLETSHDVDPESRELLEEAAADIHAALEARQVGEDASIQDRLRTALDRFEDSHPDLTRAVGRVVDALADLGI